MGRKKQSAFEDVIEITAKLPWWSGAILAIISYLLLHSVATMEVPTTTDLGQMGQVASKQLYISLATFGQYVLSAAFIIGAIISFAQQKKHSQIESGTKYQQNRSLISNNKRAIEEIISPYKQTTTQSHDSWTYELIISLEWKRFEDLCAGYFSAKSYITKTTKLGADDGIDIFLFKPGSEKPLMIVQCKAWNTQNVGVKPVRELYGVMTAEKVPLGIFTTTSDYTEDARAFAAGKRIKLLTGNDLLNLIRTELSDEAQTSLLHEITRGDYTTPTCPSCGIKMTLRTSKKGSNIGSQFWGCTNYPRCSQTLSVRKN